MASLKTARLSANDLVSNFPKVEGKLEEDLASIFGFTPDVDITTSPFSLDNSGRITRDLIKSVATDTLNPGSGPARVISGIGMLIRNTTNGQTAMPAFESEAGSTVFTLKEDNSGVDPVFSINMDDGTLSGYTTQDGASTPLIPATGLGIPATSSKYYYDATGQFSVPGLITFTGSRLLPQILTIAASSSGTLSWTSSFDVGGHFSSGTATRFTGVEAGKYLINLTIPVYSTVSNTGLDVTIDITRNSFLTDIVGKVRTFVAAGVGVGNALRYINVSTVIDLLGSDYITIAVTNNLSTTSIVVGYDYGAIGPVTYNGSMMAFRVS